MRTLIYEPGQLDDLYLERIEDTNRRLRLNLSLDRQRFLATCLTDGHLCYNRYGEYTSFVCYDNIINNYCNPVHPTVKAIAEIMDYEKSLDLRTYYRFERWDMFPPAYPFHLYEGTLGSVQSRFEALIKAPYNYEVFIGGAEPKQLRLTLAAFVICMLTVDIPQNIKLRRAVMSAYGRLGFLERTDIVRLDEEMEKVDKCGPKYGSFNGWGLTSKNSRYAYYEADRFGPWSDPAEESFYKLRTEAVLWNDGSLLVDHLIDETLSLN